MPSTRSETPRRRRAEATPWRRDAKIAAVTAILAAVLAAAIVAVIVAARDDDEAGPESSSAGLTGGDFHSLVADPVTPGRLFAGGHQAVSVSDDAGASWRRLDALDDVDAMGWGF